MTAASSSCTPTESAGHREVARHSLTTPGSPRISDEHYPPKPPGALGRRPRAARAEEAKWLPRSAPTRVRRKMAEAVDLAKMHGAGEVEAALEAAADIERFGDGELASILAHRESAEVIEFPRWWPKGRLCRVPPQSGRDSANECRDAEGTAAGGHGLHMPATT